MISDKNNPSSSASWMPYAFRSSIGLILFLQFLLSTPTQASSSQRNNSARPCLGVTIFPLYDVVRRVAGDRFEVLQLLPSGRSEHVFDPAPGDIVKVQGCPAFFAIGLGLDHWVNRIAAASSKRGKQPPRVVEIGTSANPLPLSQTLAKAVSLLAGAPSGRSSEAAALDPHVWLDPIRWEQAVRRIAVVLSEIDPGGAGGFDERTKLLVAEIAAVHAKFSAAALKWKKKSVVSVHGAFGYLAMRYGLEIPAVVELVPGHQPSAKYIASVLATVKKESISVVLGEPQIDQRTVKMISTETGARLVIVDPIGGLTVKDSWDAMMLRLIDALSGALN